MRRGRWLSTVGLLAAGLVVGLPDPAQAFWPFNKRPRPIYAAPEYSAPAMVVTAPFAADSIEYSWGAPSMRVRRTQRFYRERPWGKGLFDCFHSCHTYELTPTPYPVTSTNQSGYYYATAPW